MPGGRDDGVEEAVAGAFREEWGRVVATLIRITGDWDLAEECAQDAFARALERWPRDGIPRRAGRVAHDDGAQPRARPTPARADRCHEGPGGRHGVVTAFRPAPHPTTTAA